MPTIGFHAQHEQAHPRDLLDSAVHAEQAGFDAVMCPTTSPRGAAARATPA